MSEDQNPDKTSNSQDDEAKSAPPSNWSLSREEFHKRQLRLPGSNLRDYDPDPPRPLTGRLSCLEEPVELVLKMHGWPRKPKGPQPQRINGKSHARKLATRHIPDPTPDEIESVSDRINWFQNNAFRWKVRNGYVAYFEAQKQRAAAKAGKSKDAPVGETGQAKAVAEMAESTPGSSTSTPSDAVHMSANPTVQGGAKSQPIEPPSPAVATHKTNRERDARSEGMVAPEAVPGGYSDEPRSPPRDAYHEHVDARSLDPNPSPGTEHTPAKDTASAAPVGASEAKSAAEPESQDKWAYDTDFPKPSEQRPSSPPPPVRPPKPTFTFKEIKGPKARDLFRAIYFENDLAIIVANAKALWEDKYELNSVRSHSKAVSEYLTDVFSKLGLDRDA